MKGEEKNGVIRTQRRQTAIVVAVLALLGLTAGLGLGLVLGWVVWPVHYTDTAIADLSNTHKDEYIALVAGAYAADQDLARATARLDRLAMPNRQQSVSDLVSRYIAEGRNEIDIRHLAALARALGVDSANMAPYLDAQSGQETAEPVGLQYVVADARLVPLAENGGCAGRHSLQAQVRDANGNPLDGVVVCAYRALQAGDAAACQTSAPAGDGVGGWIEFDSYRSGEQLLVAVDATGQTYLSGLTPALSTQDQEIPVPWLVAAGYCTGEQDCRQKSSENGLCREHYSYVITFRRSW